MRGVTEKKQALSMEGRKYYVENVIGWLKKNHPRWKELNGIGVCISTVTERGVTTTAVSYSIYSCAGMSAEGYGKNKRSHWGLENNLYWVLDIDFQEDESRMRAGNVAENGNVLRHIGTYIIQVA